MAKNQNRCWNKIGSPPPAGSKNLVLKFRSVRSIVIAPAKTGNESKSKIVVISKDQTKRFIRSQVTPGPRIFTIVVIKLIEPRMDLIPAIWRLKIAKSTEWLLCPIKELRGGYTVHPAPTPPSIRLDTTRRIRAGGKSQNLKLFNRGNAISGAPINMGSIQLPNPPIIIGITKKKIIINAWAVTITLYSWEFIIQEPAVANSIRIKIEKDLPIMALQSPKMKYKVPISLWLVDMSHRITFT